MANALIFDCDGVIADTERYGRAKETKRSQRRFPLSHNFSFASTYELEMSPAKNANKPAAEIARLGENTVRYAASAPKKAAAGTAN